MSIFILQHVEFGQFIIFVFVVEIRKSTYVKSAIEYNQFFERKEEYP